MKHFIFIEGLACQTIIGCLPDERVTPQPIILDLQLFFDFSRARESDDLSDTIDYAQLTEQLNEYLQSTQFQLIEKLAEAICDWLLKRFPLQKVHLTLRKPQALAHAHTVGICLEREAHVVA